MLEAIKDGLGGCGKCLCSGRTYPHDPKLPGCLRHMNDTCPYGRCYDDRRAVEYPYNMVNFTVRKSWSRWNEPGEQEHWCRGGSFYLTRHCEHYIPYEGTRIEECLGCNIERYQDGSTFCPLLEPVGCEWCYERWEEKLEKEKN